VGSADAAPTEQSIAVYQELQAKIDTQLQKLEQILKSDLSAFNKAVKDQDLPAVIVKGKAGGR
jgi:fumarate hydratase class II